MKPKFNVDPSAMPEAAELSLSVVLLLAIGLFLGSFAMKQAGQTVSQELGGHGARTTLWQAEHGIVLAR